MTSCDDISDLNRQLIYSLGRDTLEDLITHESRNVYVGNQNSSNVGRMSLSAPVETKKEAFAFDVEKAASHTFKSAKFPNVIRKILQKKLDSFLENHFIDSVLKLVYARAFYCDRLTIQQLALIFHNAALSYSNCVTDHNENMKENAQNLVPILLSEIILSCLKEGLRKHEDEKSKQSPENEPFSSRKQRKSERVSMKGFIRDTHILIFKMLTGFDGQTEFISNALFQYFGCELASNSEEGGFLQYNGIHSNENTVTLENDHYRQTRFVLFSVGTTESITISPLVAELVQGRPKTSELRRKPFSIERKQYCESTQRPRTEESLKRTEESVAKYYAVKKETTKNMNEAKEKSRKELKQIDRAVKERKAFNDFGK